MNLDRRTLPSWVVEWCDPAITVNYRLTGGTLDATEHIEKAAERMLFPSELEARKRDIEREVIRFREALERWAA